MKITLKGITTIFQGQEVKIDSIELDNVTVQDIQQLEIKSLINVCDDEKLFDAFKSQCTTLLENTLFSLLKKYPGKRNAIYVTKGEVSVILHNIINDSNIRTVNDINIKSVHLYNWIAACVRFIQGDKSAAEDIQDSMMKCVLESTDSIDREVHEAFANMLKCFGVPTKHYND